MKSKSILLIFLLGIYSPLAAADTKPLDSLYNLGILAHNRGNNEQAKEMLEVVVKNSEDYPVAYFVLGKILRRPPFNDKATAVTYFIKAKDLTNSNALKANSLIMIGYTTEDKSEAVSSTAEAYRITSGNKDAQFAYATALYRLGLQNNNTGKYDAALPYFEKSVFVRGDLQESRNALASTYLELLENKSGKPEYCNYIAVQLQWLKNKVPDNKNYLVNSRRFHIACKKQSSKNINYYAYLREKYQGNLAKE